MIRLRFPWAKPLPPMERADEADEALELAVVLKGTVEERMERRDKTIAANHFADDIRRYLEVRPS